MAEVDMKMETEAPQNYEPMARRAIYRYQNRLSLARHVYGSSTQQLRQALEEAARQRKTKAAQYRQETTDKQDHSSSSSTRSRKSVPNDDEQSSAARRATRDGTTMAAKVAPRSEVPRHDQHKEGVARAHHSIRLQPIKTNSNSAPSSHNIAPGSPSNQLFPTPPESKNPALQKLFQSPYTEKLSRKSHSQSTFNLFGNRRSLINPAMKAHELSKSADVAKVNVGENGPQALQRSKTVPPPEAPKMPIIRSPAMAKLEKKARKEAEKAAKERKIFTILGPYHSLRLALRRRGWVEKFQNAPPPGDLPNFSKKASNDNHNDEHDFMTNLKTEPKTKPWEEGNGIYGMMSHVVRNCTPQFVFSVKSVDVDSRVTKSGQVVNHFGKARTFTTKVGLCQNVRNSVWFNETDPDTFYPRCYKLDECDEREAFIDDFKLTACFGFLKCFVLKYKDAPRERRPEIRPCFTRSNSSPINRVSSGSEPISDTGIALHRHSTGSVDTRNGPNLTNNGTSSPPSDDKRTEVLLNGGTQLPPLTERDENEVPPAGRRDSQAAGEKKEEDDEVSVIVSASPPVSAEIKVRRGGPEIPMKALEIAIEQTRSYLKFKEHEDIDQFNESNLTSSQWEQFLTWYYDFVHAGGELPSATPTLVEQCQDLIKDLKEKWPQCELDGFKNVWILKPGAKSRGRGIHCTDRLDTILGSVESMESVVAQKYIERPLLVYNTKFDIRQWFLVTDWNPLTVWFYKDCYLRFCSMEFTLDNFHEAIHLSNNSIQKRYNINDTRSQLLPDDNMWTSEEFSMFLRKQGYGDIWDEKVVTGMKNAITSSLLCTQEFIEVRKSAFELYGADFMLTDDMMPWLIEINSSPSMARTTRATAQMVDRVLEDTLKVVLDRKFDRNCSTGGFECILKQCVVTDPPPLDNHVLAINGKKVKKKTPKR